MMDKVQVNSDSGCYTPPSEPLKFTNIFVIMIYKKMQEAEPNDKLLIQSMHASNAWTPLS
jgi:hypothetical protein